MEPVRPSQRTANVRYAIRDIVALAKQLEATGQEMLWLNIGDPIQFDFETPKHITEAIADAMAQGRTSYGPSSGTPEAIAAIRRDAERKGIPGSNAGHVFVTTGASEAIELALSALLNSGDDLLVPSPGYPLYTALLSKLEANPNPYFLDEEQGWAPDIDDIVSRIGPRTRGLVLINPNNPTGAVADQAALDAVVEVARAHDLVLFADEIYDKLTLDGVRHVALASRAGDHPCVTFGGLAKCYLGPGLRVGWGVVSGDSAAVGDYAEAIGKLERARLCASHPAQAGIAVALDGPHDHVADAITRVQRRRDILQSAIDAAQGIDCVPPKGAFYAFPRLHGVSDDAAFVRELMAETGIVCVPGSGFGQRPGTSHLRFVLLPPEAIIEQAMGRLTDFLARARA